MFACDVSAGTNIIKCVLLLLLPPVSWQVFRFVLSVTVCMCVFVRVNGVSVQAAHDFSQMESLPFVFGPIAASN